MTRTWPFGAPFGLGVMSCSDATGTFLKAFGHVWQCAKWRTSFNSRVRGGAFRVRFFEVRNRELRVVLQGVEVLLTEEFLDRQSVGAAVPTASAARMRHRLRQ